MAHNNSGALIALESYLMNLYSWNRGTSEQWVEKKHCKLWIWVADIEQVVESFMWSVREFLSAQSLSHGFAASMMFAGLSTTVHAFQS